MDSRSRRSSPGRAAFNAVKTATGLPGDGDVFRFSKPGTIKQRAKEGKQQLIRPNPACEHGFTRDGPVQAPPRLPREEFFAGQRNTHTQRTHMLTKFMGKEGDLDYAIGLMDFTERAEVTKHKALCKKINFIGGGMVFGFVLGKQHRLMKHRALRRRDVREEKKEAAALLARLTASWDSKTPVSTRQLAFAGLKRHIETRIAKARTALAAADDAVKAEREALAWNAAVVAHTIKWPVREADSEILAEAQERAEMDKLVAVLHRNRRKADQAEWDSLSEDARKARFPDGMLGLNPTYISPPPFYHAPDARAFAVESEYQAALVKAREDEDARETAYWNQGRGFTYGELHKKNVRKLLRDHNNDNNTPFRALRDGSGSRTVPQVLDPRPAHARFADPNPPDAATRRELFKQSQRASMLPQANAGEKIFPSFHLHFPERRAWLLRKHGLTIPDLPETVSDATLAVVEADEDRRNHQSDGHEIVQSDEESESDSESDGSVEAQLARMTSEEQPPAPQSEDLDPRFAQAAGLGGRNNNRGAPPEFDRADSDSYESDEEDWQALQARGIVGFAGAALNSMKHFAQSDGAGPSSRAKASRSM